MARRVCLSVLLISFVTRLQLYDDQNRVWLLLYELFMRHFLERDPKERIREKELYCQSNIEGECVQGAPCYGSYVSLDNESPIHRYSQMRLGRAYSFGGVYCSLADQEQCAESDASAADTFARQ